MFIISSRLSDAGYIVYQKGCYFGDLSFILLMLIFEQINLNHFTEKIAQIVSKTVIGLLLFIREVDSIPNKSCHRLIWKFCAYENIKCPGVALVPDVRSCFALKDRSLFVAIT